MKRATGEEQGECRRETEATAMASPSTSSVRCHPLSTTASSSPSPSYSHLTYYNNKRRRRKTRMSIRSVPALPHDQQRRRRVGSKSDLRHSPSSLHLAAFASSNLEELDDPDNHKHSSRIRPDPPDWITIVRTSTDRTAMIPPWGAKWENGTITNNNNHRWWKSDGRKDNNCNINMWKNNNIEEEDEDEDDDHDHDHDDGGSSMRKALSSTVFMIRELRGHAVASQLLEEEEDDIEGGGGGGRGGVLLARVREEINESFCWLFQRVFSRTPVMMVCLMLLLAEYVGERSLLLLLLAGCCNGVHECSDGCCFGGEGLRRMRWSGGGGAGSGGCFVRGKKKEEEEEEEEPAAIVVELEEEARLWRGIMEEVGRMRGETRHEALMDHETLLGLVSPVIVNVNVVVEPDRHYPEYIKTDLMYRTAVNEQPDNPMILSNYAQFLFRVLHDLDRAEYYFKRAVEIKPADAEALNQYAQFLWLGKEDLSAAEEIYLEAIDADPSNVTYHSNYAHFLWMTGAEDTCYPLDNPSQ